MPKRKMRPEQAEKKNTVGEAGCAEQTGQVEQIGKTEQTGQTGDSGMTEAVSPFFAMLNRARLINRWSLMRNSRIENVAEHTYLVALIAHSLAVIRDLGYCHANAVRVEPERVYGCALFHDATEIITGDLPTPVKYYDDDIRAAYAKVERIAADQLLDMLPEEMLPYYEGYLRAEERECDEELAACLELVNAADRICAWLKCVEETSQGNQEFREAEQSCRRRVEELALPEAAYFMRVFAPPFAASLDRLIRPRKQQGIEPPVLPKTEKE